MLLDASLPDIDGLAVCQALKAAPDWPHAIGIFVPASIDTALAARRFDRGAADVIANPVSPPALEARVSAHWRLDQMGSEIARLSTRLAAPGH